MKRILIAGGLALAAGGQAFAADLPPPVAPPPRAPATYVPVPVAVYNWTGFYIGGNAGVGWSQGSFSDASGNTFAAQNAFKFIGGGQVGVNYEFAGGVVVGAEADFDWRPNATNTTNAVALVNGGVPTGTTASVTINNQWITTVTGRLGYAWDRLLVYGKGGWAFVGSSNPTFNNVTTGVSTTFNTTNNNYGWTAGAGFEYAFWGGWSGKIEYDYIGLTSQTLTVPPGLGSVGGLPVGDQFTGNSRNIQMIVAGINYKFGW
jgi:outer membrane immunogenic protein